MGEIRPHIVSFNEVMGNFVKMMEEKDRKESKSKKESDKFYTVPEYVFCCPGVDTGDRQILEQQFAKCDPPCQVDSTDGR